MIPMRQRIDNNFAVVGAMSGFWTWLQGAYPIIKGAIGEIAFWAGAALTIAAFIRMMQAVIQWFIKKL